MDVDLDRALRDHFGFDEFRDGQREVITALMAGHSAVAVFPTGGGKSICYQLPALLLDGVTLVVSPLIALMKDQIDALRARGIAAQRLDSTLSADEVRQVMEEMRDGSLRMLYVAPERFNNERFRESILRAHVSLFAIDEAHCISEWGHNFRPDYLKLAEFAKQCQADRVLALTATATKKVLGDVCQAFDIADEHAICTGFYRENLTLLSAPVAEAERDALLVDRLRERDPGPAIVYVTLQRTAERVAERLTRAGLDARAYHAGMDNEIRAEVQDWFLGSDSGIVVATIAFGMGVDKSNIRYIYHYNMPKSLENYSQEIGRAGRDDRPSTCETFLCMDDLNVLENFVCGDTPTFAAVHSLVREVFSLGAEFDVSYYELSATHDIRYLVVRTLMTYLELLKYFEGGTPFYSKFQFQPLMSSQEILAKFDGDRRAFLTSVFQQSRKAKTWFTIDVDQAAAAIGDSRERVVRALDYLGEQQMLEVKAQGVRNRYKQLKPCEDPRELAEKLHRKMIEREELELSRLRQVVDLVGHDGCQVGALCAYFGEILDQPCGHCTWCNRNQNPIKVPSRPVRELNDTILQRCLALRSEKPELLDDPHILARMLCGVSSPRLVKSKLTSHELYGAATDVPFADVLDRLKDEFM